EGEYPRLRPLDDVAPEPGEGLGARRASVDGGGDPTAQAVRVRVDAVVRDALVQVGMQVDQAGHQHQAADVDRLGGRPRAVTGPGQAAAGRTKAAADDGNIEAAAGDGDVEAAAGDGDVEAAAGDGDVEAAAGDGDV